MDLPRLTPLAFALIFAFSAVNAQERTLSSVNVTAKGYASADL